ncbi:MAG: MiaB/RimO family radical SAM methylthiotransferase [Alphaproteobacteria bacterium]|nr:MiaB/RimO family radical SAM methylthiotransferase [Alphaproteobacteria bacterium]
MQENLIKAFGCRLNSAETAKLELVADRAGLRGAIIFNTCAVTHEAECQARQAIRRAARNNPGRPIYVVGCAIDRDPQGFVAIPGVVRVIKNSDKFDVSSYGKWKMANGKCNDIIPAAAGFSRGLSKGFLQIQNGCDYACTYCIVHTLRGPSRSFPYEAILRQARELVTGGCSEIILTGVDIAGFEGGLVPLIEKLLKDEPGIKRLRLSSLDPAKDWQPLIDLTKVQPRVMPHLHLSMQSGSDEILRRMGRRHRAKDITRLANDKVTFSVDIICGFPGETAEYFADTVLALKALRPIRIHAFPFSARPGTPAADFSNQVPKSVAKTRVQDINALGKRFLSEFMQAQIGTIAEVLVERGGIGRTEHDIEVLIPDLPEGAIVKIRLVEVQDGRFVGQPVL